MTRQVPENIIYQGECLSLTSYPPLPRKDERVVYVEDPKSDILDIFGTTMCWRRYVGTWEIREGKLYLSQLEGRYQLNSPKPIIADWFSGSLTISKDDKGKEDSNFIIEIENGLIVG